MVKNEKDKQTTAHMTQHRKRKNKQHEPQLTCQLHTSIKLIEKVCLHHMQSSTILSVRV